MGLTQVSTDGVKNDAITKTKIPANQIEASELADNAVDTNAIADNAVSSAKIPTNAVTQAKIADDAVGADQLASNAVVTASIADNAITQAKINVPISNRNLIINGAMQVAQRGTSSTISGYGTLDRFFTNYSGLDEAPTQSQVDVASGTTPYSLGFGKAFKMTNGNQTSGAGASDRLLIAHRFEGQDIISSGWNYLSSSSNITISFWVKSSVAQNFYFRLQTSESNSPYNYPMETGALTANTWTKITKTVSGNSNLQINNDNTEGLKIEWMMFRGTNNTDSGVTLNAWAAYTSGARTPDQTSTWYTTNDATFELTGLQLEVGSVATDFEHRSFGQELALCQRYFFVLADGAAAADEYIGNGRGWSSSQVEYTVRWVNEMRAAPSLLLATGTNYYQWRSDGGEVYTTTMDITNSTVRSAVLYKTGVSGAAARGAYRFQLGSAAAYLHFNAEL